MFNLKNLFTRALLALMLVTGAGAASAGPVYHVTVDTRGHTGTGVLDFVFFGYEGAPPATAMLSNFTGDYGSETTVEGNVRGDIDSGVVLGLGDWVSLFAQSVDLGGRFGFDLAFDVGTEGEPLSFSVGMFSDTLATYLGEQGTLLQFELTPGQPDVYLADAALVNVSEVPEPASLASLALGMAMMGWSLRARRKQ